MSQLFLKHGRLVKFPNQRHTATKNLIKNTRNAESNVIYARII